MDRTWSMKATSQQLFDALYLVIDANGYQVEISPPPADTSYPYVLLGEIRTNSNRTKREVFASFNTNIQVWGLDRKTVSSVADDLLLILNEITLENGVQLALDYNTADIRTRLDNYTDAKVDYWQSIITIDFK